MEKRGPKAWLLYACVRVIDGMMRCFPVDWNLRTARLFARVWWRLIPRHRQRACNHVRMALGRDWSEEQVRTIARGSLEQLAMLAVEFLFLPRLIDEWNWHRYVRLRNMKDALRVMLDGKGALLLTGHFGNWELAGYLLAVFGFDIHAIMRPLDNVYLNRFVIRSRARKGLNLIDKKGAMEKAEDIIHQGGVLGFIADQNAGRKGIFVDFFGVAASTYKSIGLLAIRADVPIIIGYAHRLSNRFRYEVGVERIIHPHEWRGQDDPLAWITQAYTTAIEASVRRAPQQYLWIHRRWKSRPRNEAAPPPELASIAG